MIGKNRAILRIRYGTVHKCLVQAFRKKEITTSALQFITAMWSAQIAQVANPHLLRSLILPPQGRHRLLTRRHPFCSLTSFGRVPVLLSEFDLNLGVPLMSRSKARRLLLLGGGILGSAGSPADLVDLRRLCLASEVI